MKKFKESELGHPITFSILEGRDGFWKSFSSSRTTSKQDKLMTKF